MAPEDIVRRDVAIRDMDDDAAGEAIVDRLESDFKELIFSSWDPAFLETDEGKRGMRAALVDRYLASRRHAVPWLDAACELGGSTVVEIGGGTGSSTVALAERGASVVAIDIDAPSIAAARRRVEAHQVDVSTIQCEPHEILDAALSRKADLYVLFAVLEHLTEEERLDTLNRFWDALAPGGAMAIIETPNRLCYFDSHSSEQPFVHLLPDSLAFRLLEDSPRQAYRDVMRRASTVADPEAAHEIRVRFGLGASYHEFVAAIEDPLDEIVVADGYEDAITSWFGITLDEVLLLEYMIDRDVPAPMAFARQVLNVVLRKPVDVDQRRAAASRNDARRRELTARFERAPLDWRSRMNDLHRRVEDQEREIERLVAQAETAPEWRGWLRHLSGALRSAPRPSRRSAGTSG